MSERLEYSEDEVKLARCLRASTVKGFYKAGMLSREEAEELVNAPLSPDEPCGHVFDDREMLDWTEEQFELFISQEKDSKSDD